MKRSKFSESQIVAILKQVEASRKVADVCREHGISMPTYSLSLLMLFAIFDCIKKPQ